MVIAANVRYCEKCILNNTVTLGFSDCNGCLCLDNFDKAENGSSQFSV
jgi:hypothetical protein